MSPKAHILGWVGWESQNTQECTKQFKLPLSICRESRRFGPFAMRWSPFLPFRNCLGARAPPMLSSVRTCYASALRFPLAAAAGPPQSRLLLKQEELMLLRNNTTIYSRYSNSTARYNTVQPTRLGLMYCVCITASTAGTAGTAVQHSTAKLLYRRSSVTGTTPSPGVELTSKLQSHIGPLRGRDDKVGIVSPAS